MILGERIKAEMDKVGLDVTNLSAKTGISTTTLYRILGKDDCDVQQLKKIASALNLTISYLLEETSISNSSYIEAKRSQVVGSGGVGNTQSQGQVVDEEKIRLQVENEMLKERLKDKEEMIAILKSSKSA